MIEFFLVLVMYLLDGGLMGLAFVIMKANNMIDPAYEGMAIFVMVLFVIVKKFMGTAK